MDASGRDASGSHRTTLDAFWRQAESAPERRIFTFVDGEGRDRESLTIGELHRATVELASLLTGRHGLQAGERVLLIYPPSLDFVAAFVGCLVAGIIPVPLAPPNPFQLRADLHALDSAAESSASVAVLTNRAYGRMRRLATPRNLGVDKRSAWRRLPWHTTDGSKRGGGASFEPERPDPARPAFLQYTSGSTSEPKGVMISHANIVHQLEVNAEGFRLSAETRAVAWVPHFHDFCLISGILSAVHGNGHLYLMSPLSFLRRPRVWWQVMSRVGATHTAAPDFAYRLSVRKTTAEERRRWDLSSVEVVACAGEPVRPSTVDGFLDAFAEAGLRPESFCPAYGLAEHTVGVTLGGSLRIRVDRVQLERHGRAEEIDSDDPQRALEFVGCGRPFVDVDVRIVDPESRRQLPDGRVGEIWVDSPSKAMGYFGRPDLTAPVFEARLADVPDGGAYLRTGDLGFRLKGELFVAGRLKDVIIIRGRNVYPQDLEETVFSSHAEIRPGRAVAFPVDGEDADRGPVEEVVVVAEVRSKKLDEATLAEVLRAVRAALRREHRISPRTVLVAPPGEILKTTSGKLRRRACRHGFLEGGLRDRALAIDDHRS